MIQIKKIGLFVPFSIKSFTENVYSNCNIEKNKWKVTYLPQFNVHGYYISRTTDVSFTLKYVFIHFLQR